MKRVIVFMFVLAVALSAGSVYAFDINAPIVRVSSTTLTPGTLNSGATWTNEGSVGGVFTLQGTTAQPTVGDVVDSPVSPPAGTPSTLHGYRGVTFSSAMTSSSGYFKLTGNSTLPSGIIGTSSVKPVFTMAAWVYSSPLQGGRNSGYMGFSGVTGTRTAGANFYYGTGMAAADEWSAGSAANPGTTTYPCWVAGKWQHIVVTTDGANQKLYIDGNLKSSVTAPSYFGTLGPIYIGRSMWKDTDITYNFDPFRGSVGSLRIYDTSCSASDATALMTDMAPPTATFYTVTVTATAGGTVSPSGSVAVLPGGSKTFTITKSYGYQADVVADGIDQGDVPSYTFDNVNENHTLSVTFSPAPTHTISGHVDAAPDGGATVCVKASPTGLPVLTTTTGGSGNYSFAVPEGTSYICASQTGYMISADQTVALYADTGGINFTLSPGRCIPKMEYLLFAASTDDMGALGTWGNWPLLYSAYPGITALTAINTPTVTKLRGIKYDKNDYVDNVASDGYRLNTAEATDASNTIQTNGATIVALVKPVRNTIGKDYNTIAEVYWTNLRLSMWNGGTNAGKIGIWRNGTLYTSSATIPDGQQTIISLVVQPDGQFKVWTSAWSNIFHRFGTASVFMSSTATSAFNTFRPSMPGTSDFMHYITVGRNNPDNWSSFNGYIGDVFVYKTALSDTDRATLEADCNTFITTITTYDITATAGVGGSISPAGVTSVGETDNQSYTIAPDVPYDIADVVLDGTTHLGAVDTYTFLNVTAPHTIAASFSEWVDTEITGRVALADGTGIAGATVTATGDRGPFTATTGADGTYSVRVKPGSTYTLTAYKARYTTAPASLTAGPGDLTGKNFIATYVGTQKIIDLSADGLTVGSLTSWTNTGVLGGQFVSDGGKSTAVATVDANYGSLGKQAVVFNNSKLILSKDATTADASLVRAPGLITGNGTYTVFAQLCSTAALPGEQYYFAFAHNGGNGNCAAFDYGTAPAWGAVAHWGGTDMGWSNPEVTGGPSINAWHDVAIVFDGAVEKVYLDGAVVNTETKMLDLYKNNPFVIGSRFGDDTCGDRSVPFAGAMASLKVYDGALSAGQVAQLSGLPTFAITASAGTGGTISPSGDLMILPGSDQAFTITPNIGYRIDQVLVDGVNDPTAVSTGTYTFLAVGAPHTIAAVFAAVPQHTVSGRVTNSATGNGIAGATVYFSTTPNACVTSYTTTTTDGSGNYTQTLYEGAVYVAASASGHYNSPDKAVNLAADVTGVNLSVVSNVRHTPRVSDLLFAGITDGFPTTNGASIGNWDRYDAPGTPMTPINNPKATYQDNIPWVNGIVDVGTGFHALPSVAIDGSVVVNGASIVCVVNPTRIGPAHEYQDVVSVLLNKLSICVDKADGTVSIGRGAGSFGPNLATGVVVPEGQKTILSLVVQPTGECKLYVNGIQAWSTDTTYDTTTLTPSAAWNVDINIGKGWNGDGWSSFNGKIGDVFVYKAPLTDTERQTLEWDLADKFGIGGQAVTISGQVIDGNNNNPVPGATVVVQVGGVSVPTIAAVTDSTGHYTAKARLNVGDAFTVHASKLNFDAGDSTPQITFDGSTTSITGVDVYVASIQMISISGTVTDFLSGYAAAGLKLIINVPDMPANYPVITDSNGDYSVAVAAGFNRYVIGLDPTNSPMPVMLSTLADRTISAPSGLFTDVTGRNLYVTAKEDLTGLRGVVQDAATGQPIYNAVVQIGGKTGPAAVTGADGKFAFTTPTDGELYADAVGYAGRAVFVQGTGNLDCVVELTANDEVSTGLSYNGNMEGLAPTFKPTEWEAVPWNGAATSIDWSASPVAKTGSNSLFYCYNSTVTADNQYAGIRKVINTVAGYDYNFYFSTKADPEVKRWQPLFEFHDAAGDGVGNYVSNEPAPYHEYSHLPYYDWHTYFNWTDRAANVGAPVRRTPPATATTAQFVFLYEGDDANGTANRLPPVGKGCYIDDLVLDAVPQDLPFSGIIVGTEVPNETPVANLAELKAKSGTGETVSLSGVVTVASKGSGRFFIGEETYKSTIMVAANGHAMPTTSFVTTLKGVVTVDTFGQYTLTLSADPVAATTGTALKAVGANNRSAKTDANTLTKLVRVWGNVSGSTIDDGYGNPVTVKDASLGTGCVAVSGVLWKDTDGSVVLYQDLP